ncbi:hypothetical protein D9757_004354 [Collybiopsis confluens]|uniref:HMG box domain-containing protein n=1 Tax=Collybiopsis confluens TaxID=2823264 RepID=A0A8H5MD23_9AGAR|nr:hypothetical protein D9757_004354 [Collybiopsis confluens]
MPKASSPSRDEKAPKRPPNAWILFRSDMNRQLRVRNPKLTQSALSKQISELWQTATPEIRVDYERRAEAAKLAHQIQYPDYKFAPRKKEEILREKQAKLLAKEERARKSTRSTQRPPAEDPKMPSLYPSLADFGPLGPSPPGSAAGSPPDFGSSRETSPQPLPSFLTGSSSSDAGPSRPFSPPAVTDLSLPGPSNWSGSPALPDSPESWQNADLHSMLAYDLPVDHTLPNPASSSMDLSAWDDSLGVVLMGTGDSSIFQLNPFDNAVINGQQNLDLNISMGDMDNLFGTTPWDFNQTISQVQPHDNIDFAAIIEQLPDFSQDSSYDTVGESQTPLYDMGRLTSNSEHSQNLPHGMRESGSGSYTHHDVGPAPSHPSEQLDQDTSQPYVPPPGAAYSSNRRVGGSWSQYSLQTAQAAVSATAQ